MNRTTRKSFLTIKEKVLLHLLTFHRFCQDADAPKGVTQEGIAIGVGVGRNNVTKLVVELSAAGAVEIQNKHVKGLSSTRKVYFLTHRGFEEALTLKKEVEALEVRVVDMQGQEHREEFGRVGVYLPRRFSLVELALGVERGRFDCASFHEGKVKEERRFVDFTDRKPTIRVFYGREEELARLNELVDSEVTRLVVVQGIAGIGKTTLLAKFAQDRRERVNTFWFRIHEWMNLKGLLRPIAEFLSQLGKKGLEWYLTQTEAPNLGEISHLLETDLRDVTALIILDDVHKSERGVLDFLGALMGTLEHTPNIKLICTSRESLAFYHRSAVMNGVVVEIHLGGLDRESSMRLMRDRALPEEALEDIYRITKGHPFFMELVEDPKLALGKSIRMFIEQEVQSKLEITEKRILEIASVFRYPVSTDSFFVMEEEIAKEQGQGHKERSYQDYMVDYDTIEVLIRKALLNETSGRMVGMHDVMREFFYSRLSPRQRRVYHKAASRYYQGDETAPSYVEALYHSIMAGELDVAAQIAAANGRDILTRGYASLLAPLLASISERQGGEVRDHIEILLLQAEIWDIQGEWEKALDRYVELLSTASPENDRRLLAEVNRRVGVVHLRRYEYQEAGVYLKRSQEIAESIQDSHTLTQVHYDLGGVAEREGRFQEAVEHFTRAEELAKSIGDDVGHGKAIHGIGKAYSQLRDLETAVRYKRQALEVLERTSDQDEIAKVCASLGNDLWNLGFRDEGIHQLERAVELACSVGDIVVQGYALSNLAGSYVEIGNVKKAEITLERSEQIAQKLNERFLLAASHLYRGYLYHKKGDWEWAKEEFATSLQIMRDANSPLRLCYWMCEIAVTYRENSDLEGADQLFEEAMTIAKGTGQESLVKQVEEMKQSVKGSKKMEK
ncbi:MAG: tetratricopeptide repeat protein [Methanomassiliicoccales archaeon]|nr:tetratricopeptide repeat protein [Methanomassiliicoccales archaeon]